MFYSPLRYPGGKNKLAKFISSICVENDIHGHYVEPYAGGASVALFMLMEKKVSRITINDFDRSIYAFWHSVLNNTNKFCIKIEETEVNIENWKIAREIQKNKKKAKLFELGFSTFFLNRTNRSGIINAGVIGGLKQDGNYKLDCRFNKNDLIKRIREIAKYKKNITLYGLDAVELVQKLQEKSKESQTIFYFDPPYYLKGKSLYINHYNHDDHKIVSELISSLRNVHWIVSYDNTPEIKTMYRIFRMKEYSFIHTAYKSKEGKEVLFFSRDLKLPNTFNPLGT